MSVDSQESFFPYVTMVKEEKFNDFPMLTNCELFPNTRVAPSVPEGFGLQISCLCAPCPAQKSCLLRFHRCLRVEPAELNVLSECLGAWVFYEKRFGFFVVSLFVLVLPAQQHILSGAFYGRSDLCACFSVRTVV